jgi:ParB-like chromosome segregation protein Spo0J
MPKVINLRDRWTEVDAPLAKLVEDFTLYPRAGIAQPVIGQYHEALKAGVTFPPIQVDHKWRVIDGWHRLAAHRLFGSVTIPALQKRVRDDREFFELAVAANAAHGNRYSGYDRARVIARAEELGIDKERISNLLSVTVESIAEVEKGFASDSKDERPMPLKASVRHLAGRRLTQRQAEAHEHIGGMQQTFYINQVLLLLEGNLLDYKNEALMSRLYRLKQALGKISFKGKIVA